MSFFPSLHLSHPLYIPPTPYQFFYPLPSSSNAFPPSPPLQPLSFIKSGLAVATCPGEVQCSGNYYLCLHSYICLLLLVFSLSLSLSHSSHSHSSHSRCLLPCLYSFLCSFPLHPPLEQVMASVLPQHSVALVILGGRVGIALR